MSMAPDPSIGPRRFLRQTVLGSEALYEVLDAHGEIVVARVIRAPGLQRGMEVRLLARAAHAMEQLEMGVEAAEVRRFAPAAGVLAG